MSYKTNYIEQSVGFKYLKIAADFFHELILMLFFFVFFLLIKLTYQI